MINVNTVMTRDIIWYLFAKDRPDGNITKDACRNTKYWLMYYTVIYLPTYNMYLDCISDCQVLVLR